ncbi:hypothetical protein Tco_0259023, partial [Tanacetum coccineum]
MSKSIRRSSSLVVILTSAVRIVGIPISADIDLHDKEFQSSRCSGEGTSDVDTPLVEWPWRGDGCELLLWMAQDWSMYLAIIAFLYHVACVAVHGGPVVPRPSDASEPWLQERTSIEDTISKFESLRRAAYSPGILLFMRERALAYEIDERGHPRR